jgi:hypothetical protein
MNSTRKEEVKEFNIAEVLEKYLDKTNVTPDGRVYWIKAFVDRYKDLEFHIYPKDHFPLHLYVISKQRNIDARFHIETFDLISEKKGKISKNDIKKVKKFFKTMPQAREKLQRKGARSLFNMIKRLKKRCFFWFLEIWVATGNKMNRLQIKYSIPRIFPQARLARPAPLRYDRTWLRLSIPYEESTGLFCSHPWHKKKARGV